MYIIIIAAQKCKRFLKYVMFNAKKPPSDEGGGFAKGKDGGRENFTSAVSLPQSSLTR